MSTAVIPIIAGNRHEGCYDRDFHFRNPFFTYSDILCFLINLGRDGNAHAPVKAWSVSEHYLSIHTTIRYSTASYSSSWKRAGVQERTTFRIRERDYSDCPLRMQRRDLRSVGTWAGEVVRAHCQGEKRGSDQENRCAMQWCYYAMHRRLASLYYSKKIGISQVDQKKR